MSELLEQIRGDQLAARKAGNKAAAALLTTLIGEATKVTAEEFKKGQTEITDGKVVAKIKSFSENAKQTLAVAPADRKSEIQAEIDILEGYLPQQVSEDELRAIIGMWKEDGLNLGQIMAKLKAEYEGRYDGKLASSIARG